MINYYKFCCKIRIADDNIEAVDGGELMATEDGTAAHVRERFAEARVNQFSYWFHETPALAAHIRALQVRHHSTDTDNLGERLISTALAQAFTGRVRQVLYRWAREGRITRYGPPEEALWDIFELPARGGGGITNPPPPVRRKESSKNS